jgi:hypothetical protein
MGSCRGLTRLVQDGNGFRNEVRRLLLGGLRFACRRLTRLGQEGHNGSPPAVSSCAMQHLI